MLSSYLWVIPLSVIVLLLNENLFNILAMVIEDTRFAQYLTGQFAQGEVSFLFIGENLAFYFGGQTVDSGNEPCFSRILRHWRAYSHSDYGFRCACYA